jgi:hypothetical protein
MSTTGGNQNQGGQDEEVAMDVTVTHPPPARFRFKTDHGRNRQPDLFVKALMGLSDEEVRRHRRKPPKQYEFDEDGKATEIFGKFDDILDFDWNCPQHLRVITSIKRNTVVSVFFQEILPQVEKASSWKEFDALTELRCHPVRRLYEKKELPPLNVELTEGNRIEIKDMYDGIMTVRNKKSRCVVFYKIILYLL